MTHPSTVVDSVLDRPIDLLILSNGPGEVTTWVRPVVRSIRERWGHDRSRLRLSVVLSPCSHATGREADVARSLPEVDRVQSAEAFWPFLLWGKTAEPWSWRDRGAVIFLGGDQIFPVAIGRRLGYPAVVYAEWEARWPQWVARYGVMNQQVRDRLPERWRSHVAIVGDLMVEAARLPTPASDRSGRELVGLLPGSKSAKLTQGLPLLVATAREIQAARPQTRFVIPVAPTLSLAELSRYGQRATNPVIDLVQGETVRLVVPATETAQGATTAGLADGAGLAEPEAGLTWDDQLDRLPYLETPTGLRIALWTAQPAYELLAQCHLCLTTVGANTAELGALAIPMLVLLPTQQLDAMRAWDGLPGLLANLPGLGSALARLINRLALRRLGLLAWPNLWAGEQIVPELVGALTPAVIAQAAVDLLAEPRQLAAMADRLRAVRGQPGAADQLTDLVAEVLELPRR